MEKAMKNWKHIFKLDPAKEISDEQIKQICKSGTDAIIIGGTDNITLDGVVNLLLRVKQYDLPCILEISTMDSIAPGFDHYFIPIVLNSQDKKWLIDIHHKAIKRYRHLLSLVSFSMEGYCILNENSKAYKKTNCLKPSSEDVLAYAYMAEHIFKLPIFYIEYSGTFGDPQLVKKVKQELNDTLLFYGGGIQTSEQAEAMKAFADVIIVGNSIYTHFNDALETVQAVKKIK